MGQAMRAGDAILAGQAKPIRTRSPARRTHPSAPAARTPDWAHLPMLRAGVVTKAGAMAGTFQVGFTTQPVELCLDRLPVRGVIPPWLAGTLIRNGPAMFEVGGSPLRHWFDGFAMLHRFSIHGGAVAYANRFLRSRAYRQAVATGRITMREFATDPCRRMFGRIMSAFSSRPTDNSHVGVARLAGVYLAMTETPLAVRFDPETLETLGVVRDAGPGAGTTTAHPHFDAGRGEALNSFTRFGRRTSYTIQRIGARVRELASLPVAEPGYIHSFGMSARSAILAEYPFVVNPLDILLSGRPFIENFRWHPERPVRFLLFDREDGRVQAYEADPFFAFHHVNAFEHGGDTFVDLIAYPDSSPIAAFYLDTLRRTGAAPVGELRRYRLTVGRRTAGYEVLSPVPVEIPRIDYERCQMRPYRFVYGVGARLPHNFNDQILKIDTSSGAAQAWYEENCYPGEPIFVRHPEARAEDDGAVLSVVLDGRAGTSFLLVLEAASFAELGRALVPQHIPFGFHGEFFAGETPALTPPRPDDRTPSETGRPAGSHPRSRP
jgi:carotenoid cleavage dioxygenase-like enzyme